MLSAAVFETRDPSNCKWMMLKHQPAIFLIFLSAGNDEMDTDIRTHTQKPSLIKYTWSHRRHFFWLQVATASHESSHICHLWTGMLLLCAFGLPPLNHYIDDPLLDCWYDGVDVFWECLSLSPFEPDFFFLGGEETLAWIWWVLLFETLKPSQCTLSKRMKSACCDHCITWAVSYIARRSMFTLCGYVWSIRFHKNMVTPIFRCNITIVYYSPFLSMGDPGSGIFPVSTHVRTSEHMDATAVLKIIELVVDPNSNMIQLMFMEVVVYLCVFFFPLFVSTEWILDYIYIYIYSFIV